MAEIEIFSAEVCPYAARTRLLLLEKGIPFSLTEIDLGDKPAWFEEVSPYSKVPVVRNGEDVIWESSIINEYLEELYPEPPMMPVDPARRAYARVWIDFANVKLMPTWYKLFLAQAGAERAALAEELRAHFRFMELRGLRALSDKGPYWMGTEVGLVDLTFWPWFERIGALEHYRGVGLPEDCARLAAWMTAMAERPASKAIALPPETYLEGYKRYADGTEDGVTARDMRAS
jgi:glutathione S-transferase